jgi:hypothetical protein
VRLEGQYRKIKSELPRGYEVLAQTEITRARPVLPLTSDVDAVLAPNTNRSSANSALLPFESPLRDSDRGRSNGVRTFQDFFSPRIVHTSLSNQLEKLNSRSNPCWPLQQPRPNQIQLETVSPTKDSNCDSRITSRTSPYGGRPANLVRIERLVLPHAKAGYEHVTGMIFGLETAIAPAHERHS